VPRRLRLKKFKLILFIFAIYSILCVTKIYAIDPPGLASIPGYFPSNSNGSSYHYHVKTAWYDARSSKLRIGLQIDETPNYTYFFYYQTTSQASLSQAGAIYSTLLTAFSTGQEIELAITGVDGSCTGCYMFEMAQVGPQ
jgi:hypothetical protein